MTSAPHEVVDRRTVEAYQRRVGEIDQLIERAERRGRRDRVAELADERERLRAELATALGRTGRPRRFTDTGERARTAVRKAIKRAIDVVGASDGALAAELRARPSRRAGGACTRPIPRGHDAGRSSRRDHSVPRLKAGGTTGGTAVSRQSLCSSTAAPMAPERTGDEMYSSDLDEELESMLDELELADGEDLEDLVDVDDVDGDLSEALRWSLHDDYADALPASSTTCSTRCSSR